MHQASLPLLLLLCVLSWALGNRGSRCGYKSFPGEANPLVPSQSCCSPLSEAGCVPLLLCVAPDLWIPWECLTALSTSGSDAHPVVWRTQWSYGQSWSWDAVGAAPLQSFFFTRSSILPISLGTAFCGLIGLKNMSRSLFMGTFWMCCVNLWIEQKSEVRLPGLWSSFYL